MCNIILFWWQPQMWFEIQILNVFVKYVFCCVYHLACCIWFEHKIFNLIYGAVIQCIIIRVTFHFNFFHSSLWRKINSHNIWIKNFESNGLIDSERADTALNRIADNADRSSEEWEWNVTGKVIKFDWKINTVFTRV